MKTKLSILLSAVLVASGFSAMASAETDKAVCEFYNHGKEKKDRTGPCTVSREGGEIEIELYKGKVYTLTPEEKRSNRYVDQDGNRAAREMDAAWKHTYKWKNQRLIVMYTEDK
ncbi:hypothetical protein R0135_06165 [Congregibacter variabilis]|uniref:Uncharacterized protein n=1 Tax=Congregibacter variabilis TaxID=3081200 RepID=A0ABZ0I5E5_9GAMM|nr:hypothetical protein R0135_06165 [Congregibacter sp. IMCC43200]